MPPRHAAEGEYARSAWRTARRMPLWSAARRRVTASAIPPSAANPVAVTHARRRRVREAEGGEECDDADRDHGDREGTADIGRRSGVDRGAAVGHWIRGTRNPRGGRRVSPSPNAVRYHARSISAGNVSDASCLLPRSQLDLPGQRPAREVSQRVRVEHRPAADDVGRRLSKRDTGRRQAQRRAVGERGRAGLHSHGDAVRQVEGDGLRARCLCQPALTWPAFHRAVMRRRFEQQDGCKNRGDKEQDRHRKRDPWRCLLAECLLHIDERVSSDDVEVRSFDARLGRRRRARLRTAASRTARPPRRQPVGSRSLPPRLSATIVSDACSGPVTVASGIISPVIVIGACVPLGAAVVAMSPTTGATGWRPVVRAAIDNRSEPMIFTPATSSQFGPHASAHAVAIAMPRSSALW